MLQQSPSILNAIDQVAVHVPKSPSYLAQGIGTSVAAHALAAGGYSLYLLCASWLANANLPEWMPPQSGVRSRPQMASQAIVLEAAFSEPVAEETQAVAVLPQPSRLPRPEPPLDAVETLLEHIEVNEPVLAERRESEVAEMLADASELIPQPSQSARATWQDQEPVTTQTPRSAQVAKRGHGVAVQTITSVASVAAQESHGAETDALPQKLFNPEPDYPAAQYAARIGGTVRIRIRLGDSGRVIQATIHSTSGVAALDQAALEAVRRWRFEAVSTSHPTARELIFPIRFDPPE